ncbi:MAG: carboxypeptidase-like regulatory domain-containing protein [Porphyromonadaceae bacterium]|nr:MAG: carboxypeptidase-like regulatory domain-containing protein [Porphyromonadaceae bacterium]
MIAFQKSLFLQVFLLFSFSGFSQKYQLEGTIRDSETYAPINAVSIILKNSGRGTASNDQGSFRFEFYSFPAVLFIQCMGYVRDTVIIESESQFITKYKNQNRVFLLKQSPIQINEVQVKARSTLFEKDPYAIIDFKIVGKRIVAFGYKNGNEFRKEVLLADLSGKMISNHIYKNLDSLFQDCQGNVFAFCADSVLELKLSRKQIMLQNGYRRDFITDFIVPVCGMSDSMIFLKKSSANHQYDNYYVISDSQKATLIYSTGELWKERQVGSLRYTWKIQARQPDSIQPFTGRGMGPDWIAYMNTFDGLYHSYFNSQFKLQVDYPTVFTKMIPNGKNHLIFDREAATIFWLDERGGITREVGMNNKLNGFYYQDVHLDTGTNRIYIEYPQGPFTHFIEINPETGQEVRRFMVWDFRHIEKCLFLNDRLYFLYQPDMGKRIKKVFTISI